MGRDWFPKRTIGSLVDERATRDGVREALVFEGRRWTFAELARDVDAVDTAVTALLDDPARRAELAAGGRAQAATWPTEEQTVDRVRALYAELTGLPAER